MPTRNTATRDKHRRILRRGNPPCGICHLPIDYTLRNPNPKCFVVDHIIPLRFGGTDDIDNKQPAHRDCNMTKGSSLPAGHEAPGAPRTFVTTRTWGGDPR